MSIKDAVLYNILIAYPAVHFEYFVSLLLPFVFRTSRTVYDIAQLFHIATCPSWWAGGSHHPRGDGLGLFSEARNEGDAAFP